MQEGPALPGLFSFRPAARYLSEWTVEAPGAGAR